MGNSRKEQAQRSALNRAISNCQGVINEYKASITEEENKIREYEDMISKMSSAKDELSSASTYLGNADEYQKEGYQTQNTYGNINIGIVAYVSGSVTLKIGYLGNCIAKAEEKLKEHQNTLSEKKAGLEQAEGNLQTYRNQLYTLNHAGY